MPGLGMPFMPAPPASYVGSAVLHATPAPDLRCLRPPPLLTVERFVTRHADTPCGWVDVRSPRLCRAKNRRTRATTAGAGIPEFTLTS